MDAKEIAGQIAANLYLPSVDLLPADRAAWRKRTTGEIADALAAAVREARRAALGEAAKAVCPMCMSHAQDDISGKANFGPAIVLGRNRFRHAVVKPPYKISYRNCLAAPIHALLAAEEQAG